MDFFLAQDGPVLVEILDSSGAVVRTLSSQKSSSQVSHTKGGYALQDADAAIVPIKVKTGMNRIAWNLRRAAPQAAIPGVYLRRAAQGRFVAPGTYSVRLTAAGQVSTVPLEILADPRSPGSPEDFAAQDRLLVLVEEQIASMRQTVLELISVHDQVVAATSRLSNPAAIKAGKSLADELDSAKNEVVQHGVHRREGGVPRNLLYDYMHSFHSAVNTPDATLDAAKSDLYPSLRDDWLAHKRRIDTLLVYQTRVVQPEVGWARYATGRGRRSLKGVCCSRKLTSSPAVPVRRWREWLSASRRWRARLHCRWREPPD